MATIDLHALPRFRDGLSYLYVEHAVIEREANAIALYREDGAVSVPAAGLAVLVLGPGTRITHAAMVALAQCGTSVVWAGEEHQRFYAWGTGKTRSSANVLRQAAAWADPRRRLEVVQRLYRFRFVEEFPAGLTLQQIRGREGARVRDAYAAASRTYGVPWSGRSYQRGQWHAADPVNRAISAGAACLYGVCHSAIVAAGYSPAIGFIHEGKQLSFVYDLADVYKVEVLVPAAFQTAAERPAKVESAVRARLRERLREVKLLPRAVEDLARLFDGLGLGPQVDADELPEEFLRLWDPAGSVEAGKNYACDDA